MGSWAGLAALTRWIKALMEQEDEERMGRYERTLGHLHHHKQILL